MKLNHLNNNHIKNNKEVISVGVLAVSAAMVVLIAVKVTAFIAAPARAENSIKKAVELSKLDSEEVDKHLAKSKEIADQLKNNNLFAPPPPKQHLSLRRTALLCYPLIRLTVLQREYCLLALAA